MTRYEADPPEHETEALQQATHRIRGLVMGLIDRVRAAGQMRADIDTGAFSNGRAIRLVGLSVPEYAI